MLASHKLAFLLNSVRKDLARLRRVGRRAELGEDVRRRTRRQHLHDGGHERARRRARDPPPTGEPRQGPGALREATSRQHVSTAGDRVFERSRTEGPA